MNELLLLIQARVGFPIILYCLVRAIEMGIAHAKAGSTGWAITYGIVAVLLLLAALITLGFHA